MTTKTYCAFLFVLLCVVSSIHCDTFYINAVADGTSTDCSEATPCQSFSQVITTFPDATAYDLNVAPGVYGNSSNVGLVFTVPVTIQPYSPAGQVGQVVIDAGEFEGAVINATSSVSITRITMVANATVTANTILLLVSSLESVTLQQVNLTTIGLGVGLQVDVATSVTLSGSSLTSASIIVNAAGSITISNTVFTNTSYPAVSLSNAQTVVIDSSVFELAEVKTNRCNETTLSNSVFNAPPNSYSNFATFYSAFGVNVNVNNVTMAVTETSSQYSKTGLQTAITGNLTVDTFQSSGPYVYGIDTSAVSSTLSNIKMSDTTMYAINVQANVNFYLSQFEFTNCVTGVNSIAMNGSTVKITEGTATNTVLFFSAVYSANVSPGEISNVQLFSTVNLTDSQSNLISVSPGDWLISNLTASSVVDQTAYNVIYGRGTTDDKVNVVLRGINLSGYGMIDSVLRFDTPALNLTITDSTFSNFFASTPNGAVGNILSGGFCDGAVIYIDNCVFSDSQFTAITTTNSTFVDIRNSVFSNIAYPQSGYSSFTVGFFNAANVSVVNTSFIGNSFGTGSLSITGTSAVISNCTFSGNAGERSGAFASYQSGFTVSGSTFTNNTASTGGAIYGSMMDTVPINVTSITDTTFTGNNGSAVYLTANSQGDSDNNWEVFVGGLTFNDNTEYAIQCVNGVTVEYQGAVTINGEDSKDDISGCTITEDSSYDDGGSSWVWTAILIAVIVIIALIILIILGAIIAAVVIFMKRKRSSYVALDDE